MVLDELGKHDKFVIYGAQVIAYGAKEAIEHLTGRRPKCFAVGRPQGKTWFPTGNPDEIDGIPVKPIDEVDRDTFIVVAVTELIQQEAVPYLKENGYGNYYALTQHEEHLLMRAHYDSTGAFPAVGAAMGGSARPERMTVRDAVSAAGIDVTGEDSSGQKKQDFVLYEVRNDQDKILSEHPALFPYERTIQAGAALADVADAEARDDTGDHISLKNRMYCEMTAVYWIWKNTDHDWIGIEHYRRHLLVRPEMLADGIDAIMPLPYMCYPNEMAQFLRFTTEDVLTALLKALQKLHQGEYEDYHAILYGRYQYTYDLLCARRAVFDDYCGWFFEITEYMETMAGEVPEIRETRALSYVAEVLTNLYFMYHQKDLVIRHVEKAIYV